FSLACRPAALSPELSPDNFIADVVNVYRRAAREGLPIFVLGHSEGVTYVNEAAARRAIEPRGLILLAGVGRYGLDETLLRQYDQGLSDIDAALADPKTPSERRSELEKAKRQTEELRRQGRDYFRRLDAGQVKPDERYLGAYARFWREEIAMTRSAAAVAAQVSEPALILRGDRDQNVTHEDWEALKNAMRVAGSDAHELPGLDHLFVPEGGTVVDPAVGPMIADWILARLGVFVPAAPARIMDDSSALKTLKTQTGESR
ncbi:MAG: alpha/beta hydrolase, partial [Elusimicrobia bacterium]|nr:alpha/beta hydrolase [Elusimicrobiota bacterium]